MASRICSGSAKHRNICSTWRRISLLGFCENARLMNDDVPDSGPTPEQSQRIAALTSTEIAVIDARVLASASTEWRKLARVVATAMMQSEALFKGVPDIYYALRAAELVRTGKLESRGDLSRMRFCEVRLNV